MSEVDHTGDDLEPVLEQDFGGRYFYLFHEVLLTGRSISAQASRRTGMLIAELEVIRELAAAGGRSHVSVIARELGVDAAAISRVVSGLERRGLVVREVDPRDGRLRPVLLSDEGRQFTEGFQAYIHDLELALASAIDADSLETTIRVLQEARDALDVVSRRRTAPPTASTRVAPLGQSRRR